MSPAVLEKLKAFADLPDDCAVSDPLAAAVLGISLRTLRRSDPVRKIQLSPGRNGRRVGDIRAKIRGELVAA
jgi:hypothetical protein